MTGYLINFAVYTMAMIGAILLCFVIYKKTVLETKFSKTQANNLEIENALNISQRKTLYVVKAGEEKFLIASDPDCTTLLARLNEKNTENIQQEESETRTIDVEPVRIPKYSTPVNYSGDLKRTNKNKQPMMRKIIKKLNIPE